jgi:hypothetical protein
VRAPDAADGELFAALELANRPGLPGAFKWAKWP